MSSLAIQGAMPVFGGQPKRWLSRLFKGEEFPLSLRSLRKRILVVDDEENYRSLLSKTLTKAGYEVETAAGGAAALQIARTTPCDLALIDLRMSLMTGLELLEAMRGVSPATKIFIYTGYPSPETSKLAYLKGALAYLPKPLDLEDLKERIAQALRAGGDEDVGGGLS